MSEIIQNKLYLGDYVLSTKKAVMESMTITDIINVAYDCEKPKDMTLSYHHFPLMDVADYNIRKHCFEIVDLIHMLLENGCVVYIHCVMGISRSPSIVILYFMKYNNMTYDQAFHHVNKKRPGIRPNERFEADLRKIELELK